MATTREISNTAASIIVEACELDPSGTTTAEMYKGVTLVMDIPFTRGGSFANQQFTRVNYKVTGWTVKKAKRLMASR